MLLRLRLQTCACCALLPVHSLFPGCLSLTWTLPCSGHMISVLFRGSTNQRARLLPVACGANLLLLFVWKHSMNAEAWTDAMCEAMFIYFIHLKTRHLPPFSQTRSGFTGFACFGLVYLYIHMRNVEFKGHAFDFKLISKIIIFSPLCSVPP